MVFSRLFVVLTVFRGLSAWKKSGPYLRKAVHWYLTRSYRMGCTVNWQFTRRLIETWCPIAEISQKNSQLIRAIYNCVRYLAMLANMHSDMLPFMFLLFYFLSIYTTWSKFYSQALVYLGIIKLIFLYRHLSRRPTRNSWNILWLCGMIKFVWIKRSQTSLITSIGICNSWTSELIGSTSLSASADEIIRKRTLEAVKTRPLFEELNLNPGLSIHRCSTWLPTEGKPAFSSTLCGRITDLEQAERKRAARRLATRQWGAVGKERSPMNLAVSAHLNNDADILP